MKKKYIAIIVCSTVALLFGSLIFCAINAFPELLEEEQETKAIEMVDEEIIDVPFEYEDHAIEETYEAPVVTIETEYTYEAATEVATTTNFEVEEVVVTDDSVAFTATIIEETKTIEETVVEPEIVVEEALIEDVSIDYEEMEIIENIDEDLIVKTAASEVIEEENVTVLEEGSAPLLFDDIALSQQYANNKAHKEIIECTLLVVCVVEILSVLFLKRKKFRRFRF